MTFISRPLATRTQEWLYTLCCLWFIAGLFLDGWAHNHLESSLESFFTPWHAVFYSGYMVTAAAALWIAWLHRSKGRSFWRSAPSGYEYALLGAGLFALGGVGDMLWHITFGIEADIEALLSPTHLLLATSAFLMVGAPFLAWYRKPSTRSGTLVDLLPMILSLTFLLTTLSFMTQFAHFSIPRAGGAPPDSGVLQGYSQALTVAGYLLQSIFLTGGILLALRRNILPFGAVTILLLVHTLLMGVMRDGVIFAWAALLLGLAADLAVQTLHPFTVRTGRIFSFALPAGFFLLYTMLLLATSGTWWSIHMWTGAIVMAGMAGLVTSLLVWPPAIEKSASM